MLGLSKTDNMEDLLPFGIRDITRILSQKGQTLGGIDRTLQERPGSYAIGGVSWEVSKGVRDPQTYSVGYEIRRDSEGLYLELLYTISSADMEKTKRDRFYLVQRESNLLPGTYRYYFVDPYSLQEDSLCSKVYFFRGGFVTRSLLRSYGVIYKQQRNSHVGRYVWDFYHRIPDNYPKYLKSHYRGRVTKRYQRYIYNLHEGERRVEEYLCKNLLIFPSDLESPESQSTGIPKNI